MNVVAAYLYGSLDSDIYMKGPDGIFVSNTNANRNMYYVKLDKSLYGLKQSRRMWFMCPCVFIRKSNIGFLYNLNIC
jgi:hypothetical protein